MYLWPAQIYISAKGGVILHESPLFVSNSELKANILEYNYRCLTTTTVVLVEGLLQPD